MTENVTDDLFDDTPLDEDALNVEGKEPLTNHQRAARQREQIKREKQAAEMLLLREELKAELLAELRQTMTVANVVAEVVAETLEPTIDPNAFQPVVYWAATYAHEPRVKRPGERRGFIHFRQGRFVATTQEDVDLIEANLANEVWRENIPVEMVTAPDPATGWNPRAWQARDAFVSYSKPQIPEMMPL